MSMEKKAGFTLILAFICTGYALLMDFVIGVKNGLGAYVPSALANQQPWPAIHGYSTGAALVLLIGSGIVFLKLPGLSFRISILAILLAIVSIYSGVVPFGTL
jgi:hypothetical protein